MVAKERKFGFFLKEGGGEEKEGGGGDPHSWGCVGFVDLVAPQDSYLPADFVSVFSWDWMHVYVSDGIFVVEFRELMSRLDRSNVGGRAFDECLQRWRWPKAYASAASVCSSADHLPSGSASEMISAAPVLGKFLREVVQPANIAAKETFLNL